MIDDNERWQEFRKELEARGISIRWAWQAKSDPSKKHCNVHFATFYGSGFQPKVLCAVVIDYGPKDGFGLFTDESGRTMEAEAAYIAGTDR